MRGRTLAPGVATGPSVRLEEPLSLWGGMDPHTGVVIDRRHPQAGAALAGRVVLMSGGRGSSSSSSILAEAIRAGAAPLAFVLAEPDPILALGSVVAAELYGREVPVVVLDTDSHRALPDGAVVTVEAGAETATVVTAIGDGSA